MDIEYVTKIFFSKENIYRLLRELEQKLQTNILNSDQSEKY